MDVPSSKIKEYYQDKAIRHSVDEDNLVDKAKILMMNDNPWEAYEVLKEAEICMNEKDQCYEVVGRINHFNTPR